MTQTQKRYSIVAAGAVVAVLALGAGTVLAAEGSETSFAQRIAERFNLNQEEVQSFLDEHREEMKAQHQARFEERLATLVDDGTLTAEQSAALQGKMQELHDNKPDLSDLSHEDRHAAMQDHRAELTSWAEDQGISLDAIFPKGQGEFRGKHKGSRPF